MCSLGHHIPKARAKRCKTGMPTFTDLFLLVADVLLQELDFVLGKIGIVRAFADDTAVVLEDYNTSHVQLVSSRISNRLLLCVNESRRRFRYHYGQIAASETFQTS